jgi:hypothetical protein
MTPIAAPTAYVPFPDGRMLNDVNAARGGGMPHNCGLLAY